MNVPRILLPLVLVVAGVALVTWLLPVREWLVAAMTMTFYLGLWGLLFFYVVYVALACLSVPITPLDIAAGILFHLWAGYAVALAGAVTSAVLVFLFARYAASDWVRARLARVKGSEDFLARMASEGVKFVAITRCNPFVPAAVKNFGFAVTDVSLRQYATGTFLGQVPVVFVHVYIGWVGGVAMMRGDARPDSLRWVVIGAGIVTTIALAVLVYWLLERRRAR